MKKILKILLIVGLSLTLLGGLVFFIGFAATGFDVHALGNRQVEEKRYAESAENPVSSVTLDFETADYHVIFDETAESVVIDYPQLQNKKGKNRSVIKITETENAVSIVENSRDRFFISWNFTSPTVTVYLPASRTYSLEIVADAGDISLEGEGKLSSFSFKTDTGDVNAAQAKFICEGDGAIQTDTGDVKLGEFEIKNLSVNADTGDLRLAGGKAAGGISLKTDTGNVSVSGILEANFLSVDADTGNIQGADGILDAATVILYTETGNIYATLVGDRKDYAITVQCDTGDSNITSNLGYVTSPARVFKAGTATGNIRITFTENN